jgi:putative transposase
MAAMPRPLRNALGGIVYHVLNRSNGRMTLFATDGDYQAFEETLRQAYERIPLGILSYCLMPNHWHLLLWPNEDGQLSEFMRWLTVTHSQRWHAFHETSGTGHLYQGRFKSFPVQKDSHYLTVARYVEGNALRAGLVKRAEDWRWGSLWRRVRGGRDAQALLADWPVERPRNWVSCVNRPEDPEEIESVRACVLRGRPFGTKPWLLRVVQRLGLQAVLRPRGRPRKRGQESFSRPKTPS